LNANHHWWQPLHLFEKLTLIRHSNNARWLSREKRRENPCSATVCRGVVVAPKREKRQIHPELIKNSLTAGIYGVRSKLADYWPGGLLLGGRPYFFDGYGILRKSKRQAIRKSKGKA
jgi:hypothetical protein